MELKPPSYTDEVIFVQFQWENVTDFRFFYECWRNIMVGFFTGQCFCSIRFHMPIFVFLTRPFRISTGRDDFNGKCLHIFRKNSNIFIFLYLNNNHYISLICKFTFKGNTIVKNRELKEILDLMFWRGTSGN